MLKNSSLGVLIARYYEVFQFAWKSRHFDHKELAEQYESEFLPDAIELQETNTSPILAWTAYLLIAMLVTALAWACLGKVDIVAVASGRLISNDYTKNIQSLGTSKIQAILVKNGETVKIGQLLLQLDDAEARANIDRFNALIPLLNKKVIAYKALLADGYVSEHDSFDKEKELLEAIAQLKQAQYTKQTMAITSPIDGVVSGLTVHTTGGVVTPGQLLLTVVPSGGDLMLEAYLNNKDVGFVKTGQEVAIKLEAFPFTRYGLIKGVISTIATDSIDKQGEKPIKTKESDLDEKAQTTNNYQIRVLLDRSSMMIEGQSVPLASGMVATAEIKTGKRTLISYLLSPLVENVSEAARER